MISAIQIRLFIKNLNNETEKTELFKLLQNKEADSTVRHLCFQNGHDNK